MAKIRSQRRTIAKRPLKRKREKLKKSVFHVKHPYYAICSALRIRQNIKLLTLLSRVRTNRICPVCLITVCRRRLLIVSWYAIVEKNAENRET